MTRAMHSFMRRDMRLRLHTCKCSKMLTRFYLAIFVLPSVKLFGVELNCPVFKDGVNEILCKINETAISHAGCRDMYKKVIFNSIDRKNNPVVLCQASSICNPSESLPPKNCCCHDPDEEIKTCKLSYVANRSYDEGAKLECKYCVEPDSLDVKDETCRNISFADFSSGAEMIIGTPTWMTGLTVTSFVIWSAHDW